jgi:hypothetical protein
MSNKLLPPPPEVNAAFGNPREYALDNMNKVNQMQTTLIQSAGKKFNYKSKAYKKSKKSKKYKKSKKSKKSRKSNKSKKSRKSRKYKKSRKYFARGGNAKIEVKVVPTLFNDVGSGNQSSQGSQVAALQNSVNANEMATYDKNVTLAKPIPASQLSSSAAQAAPVQKGGAYSPSCYSGGRKSRK